MQKSVAEFLFRRKSVPLPGCGVLRIQTKPAESDGVAVIQPPVPQIIFERTEADAGDFIAFIAQRKYISTEEAAAQLESFCSEVQLSLKTVIPGVGNFISEKEDELFFEAVQLLNIFLPAVAAVPIAKADHPEETPANDQLSSESADEFVAAPKSRWWIAAMILLLCSLALIVFYLNGNRSGYGKFGNSTAPAVAAPAPQYSTIP